MLLNQNDIEVSITVSEVIEHMFCPRFTYFMNCLSIPQKEGERYKVKKGRKIHEDKSKINKEYLRKKLGVKDKEISVYLSSTKYKIRGIVDEVLFLNDGTASPLDYKFAEFKEKVFKTYKYQIILYGLMIKDIYNIDVKKGFICYTRSNNLIKEIKFRNFDFENVVSVIDEILEIIIKGTYPKKTKYLKRCFDCCYRNICVR